MKQNKQEENIDIKFVQIVLTLLIIVVFVIFLDVLNNNDIKRLEKHDTCLTQAITVNPDPNLTEERSVILKECMSK